MSRHTWHAAIRMLTGTWPGTSHLQPQLPQTTPAVRIPHGFGRLRAVDLGCPVLRAYMESTLKGERRVKAWMMDAVYLDHTFTLVWVQPYRSSELQPAALHAVQLVLNLLQSLCYASQGFTLSCQCLALTSHTC